MGNRPHSKARTAAPTTAAKPPVVMIATPAYGGTTHLRYTAALAETTAELQRFGVGCCLNLAGCFSQIHAARNYMAAQFLSEPALTHLMFIDADISWPPGSILKLLRHGQPMVCGLYPNKTPECDFAFYPVPGSEVFASRERGIRIEIELALTGFLLIGREVFLRLIEAKPELRLRSMGQGGEPDPRLAPWLYDFFPTVREDGLLWSEDFGLSRLWRSIGGQIWCDPTIQLSHYGVAPFTRDPMEMLSSVEVRGAAA